MKSLRLSALGPSHAESADPRALIRFLSFFVLIAAVYGSWLAVFWPGVLGEDSVAILREVQPGSVFQSGKSVLWYYFVRATYGLGERIEVPIALQLLLAAFFFARILSWCMGQGLRKITFFGLVFIALAPHMVFFAGTLYPDALYAVGTAGLLFEFWLVATRRRLSAGSLAVIAIAFPLAVFARSNGIVVLLAVPALWLALGGADRIRLLLVVAGWCLAIAAGERSHPTEKHGVLFPLALFETVNFLQPRPMKLWTASPRISAKTVQILERHHPIDKIVQGYDPDYWDSLIYREDGPKLGSLTDPERRRLVREFFSYNLWRNLPDFLSSRVNVFLVASLAGGGFPSFEGARYVIPAVNSTSVFRAMQLTSAEQFLKRLHDASYGLRWLLWTPLLGVFLVFSLMRTGWQRRDLAVLVVTVPMALQLAGIFFFSIAGEYRYLLPYFVLPLALLPIRASLMGATR